MTEPDAQGHARSYISGQAIARIGEMGIGKPDLGAKLFISPQRRSAARDAFGKGEVASLWTG